LLEFSKFSRLSRLTFRYKALRAIDAFQQFFREDGGIRMERLYGFRKAIYFLLYASPAPNLNREIAAVSTNLVFEQARCLLNLGIVRSCSNKDKFFQRGLKFPGLLNFRLEFGLGHLVAVITIFALALDSELSATAAAALSKDVHAVLTLPGAAVVLDGRVLQRILEEKPAVAFERLPILWLWYLYGG
jgi:hypothetical protein